MVSKLVRSMSFDLLVEDFVAGTYCADRTVFVCCIRLLFSLGFLVGLIRCCLRLLSGIVRLSFFCLLPLLFVRNCST